MASNNPHHYADIGEEWKLEETRTHFTHHKEVGQKKWIMNPRGLDITWGGKEEGCWTVPGPKEKPVTLDGVCWLEVSGSKKINPRKSYQIGFNVSLSQDWSAKTPLYVMAKLGEKGSYICRKVNLEGESLGERFDIPQDKKFVIKFSPRHSSERKLYFGLYDTWTNVWKTGLHIHHAFVAEEEEEEEEEEENKGGITIC